MAIATTIPTCNHTSAGVILLSPDKQSLFIQKRQKFPSGWACPAGQVDEGGKFPTMWAGPALKRGTLPSILSQRIIDRMESRSRSESPHTVFVNSAPIFRGTFGGSLLERISRTGQFGTSVDSRIEWENIE